MTKEKLHFGRYDYASFAAFIMYSVCSLAIPLMIVSMGNDLHFPLDKGGMGYGGFLHIVRSFFMLLALLVCGFIAAKLGKRILSGTSLLLFGLGMMGCAFTTQYWMLMPCLILAGIGEGTCEGILTPVVQDLHPDAPERYVNISHAFWSVGIFLAVLLAGGLISLGVHWRQVMGVIGLLTFLASLLFLWKENPAKKFPEAKEKVDYRQLWERSKIIFRQKRFWICAAAMFFGAGAEFGITFWSAAFIELTFKTSVFVAGLGTACIAVGMFIGRTSFGYIAKPDNLRYILMCASLSTIPLTFFLAFLEPGLLPQTALFTVLFLTLFLCGIGVAPYWPTTQVYGVNNLPQCDSTLLYVYYSALGIPGCGFFTFLMGYAGDKFGLRGTILVVPVCLLVFAGIIWYECFYSAGKKAENC
ncbi:MAG: MFS transporter [Lentisphaeria bacterium]|nr:MFS transporter [Lentisphaeria bacterium]